MIWIYSLFGTLTKTEVKMPVYLAQIDSDFSFAHASYHIERLGGKPIDTFSGTGAIVFAAEDTARKAIESLHCVERIGYISENYVSE